MWKATNAECVVNLVLPCFEEDVLTAVNSHEKGAVAFDATGGGTLAMDYALGAPVLERGGCGWLPTARKDTCVTQTKMTLISSNEHLQK